MSASPTSRIPADFVALCDYERHARERLDANAWAWVSGGAADEITLRANREAWGALRLQPRVLRDLAGGHTRVELLGRTLAHPLLLAPVAHQRLVHADGELASAHAAAAQDAGMVLSLQSSVRLEAVAAAAQGAARRGPLWLQLYLLHDRSFMRELLQRAEAGGFEALMLTVDAPTSGARDRERRAGFHLPAGVSAVNLRGLPPMPQVLLGDGRSALFDGLLRHAPTWRDIEWLQGETRLPLLLKGVLHEDDAAQAVARPVSPASSSRTTAGARSTLPSPPPGRCRVSPIGWPVPCRCWSTAASAAAPMCSPPCHSARARCSSDARKCMRWRWPAPSVSRTCCATRSRSRWRSPVARRLPTPRAR